MLGEGSEYFLKFPSPWTHHFKNPVQALFISQLSPLSNNSHSPLNYTTEMDAVLESVEFSSLLSEIPDADLRERLIHGPGCKRLEYVSE